MKTKTTHPFSLPESLQCQETCILNQVFSRIKFGVLIVNREKKELIFHNEYVTSISKGDIDLLLSSLLSYLADHSVRSGKQEDFYVTIDELDINVGFSVYLLPSDWLMIFLKDISGSKIFQESSNKSQFYSDFSGAISEISHEIGNPLSSINTMLQVLLTNIEKWDVNKSKDYLIKSVQEIKRLTRFLKQIRDFSHDAQLKTETVNLNDTVNQLLAQNEILLEQNNVSCQVNIQPDTTVLIDRDSFYQILLNLLNNSLDALSGTQEPVISISAKIYDENFVELIYKNNGKPISPRDYKKIFTPLFSTKEEGRGMGLAISQKLMTLMGGTIRAGKPEGGVGAEFNLYIPLQTETDRIY